MMNDNVLSQTQLREHASELLLHGLLAHWGQVMGQPETARWMAQLLGWQAAERHRRSLERRLRAAHIGAFKPLDFLKDASNIVLLGPNGVGKTMCACSIGYQAVLAGHTALFVAAGQLLGELAALDSDSALRRRLRFYAAPDVLLIDEVAYLSCSNRHADLLFELLSRRYQNKSIVVTTNLAFAEWGEVFPNAACVVSLIYRLMHRAEVIRIAGESFRKKEADERQAVRQTERAASHQTSRFAWTQGGIVTNIKSIPLPVPTHCSPEQALAAFECLHALREAIWMLYGQQIQQAWRDQLVPDTAPPDFDPDAPF